MRIIEIAFALLLLAVLVSAFVPRFKLPFEVVLLLASLGIGFIPNLPRLTLDPDLVFFLFLPPILFAAAYFTSWRDFKKNIRPISLLAIGLVLFTTMAVALTMKTLIPAMGWPFAILLGAIVSPPDASAATAITRKLGIPRRLATIIEGESLVNDATALVLYRFAMVTAVTGVFSLGTALLTFVFMGVGGVAIGFLTGMLGMALYKKMPDDNSQILISFLCAFAAYSLGEHLHVSGVISTVTAGLYFGRHLPAHASPELRIEAKADWDLILFIINGFVFTLMGLQLAFVLRDLNQYTVSQLALYAVSSSLVVILVRFVWVFPATYLPRLLFRSICKNDPAPTWQSVTALSFTGMRGIVSLAAALALPQMLPSGEAFPYRHLLIFLTYTTILSTVLIPSLTLPALMRLLGLKAGSEAYREEVLARKATAQAVLKQFPVLREKHGKLPIFLKQLEERYARRVQTLESNLLDTPYSQLFDEDRHVRYLLRDTIRMERQSLNDLRFEGAIHDEVFHALGRELDLEEMRLKTERI